MSERFPVDPWVVREIGLDESALAQSESIFALSNGHIGVRGNLDEGDPNGLPGTYLNSFYEARPLPYAEAGYGYPESGQTVLNVTNGKIIRLLVDDEPLDLRYGTIIEHERVLDLRKGVLDRSLIWESPAGTRVKITSTRLVSLARRSLLAIRYRVEPVDRNLKIVAHSELVTGEETPAASHDPRVSATIADALEPVRHDATDLRAVMMHRTKQSGLTMAAAMDHGLQLPDNRHVTEMVCRRNFSRVTVGTALDVGQHLEITKFVTYGWSSTRSVPALYDQVTAALTSAIVVGWDGVQQEHIDEWAEFWSVADVEIDGPTEIQQAVRFGLFHAHQAAVRAEQRAVPAKGLTGPGYDGHSFWDTESFVLPLLTATAPAAAADALYWRYTILDLARERAATLRLRGAALPWRTIRGQECSAYWPAGTAAFHVNADVAVAAARHVWWTGDDQFARHCALPLLVETARLWVSLGYRGDDGEFHIDGVTGPDEYTAMCFDNLYTNLLAAQNLRAAVREVGNWPDEAAALEVTDAEIADWTWSADHVSMPFSETQQVYEQCRGFTAREVWDFANSDAEDEYPLLLHAPYFDLYRSQVIKQADLVLALHWAGDAFSPEEKARAFAYYEPLTVRDSSLSACTQAVVAAEVGHLDLAAEYLAEAALLDLRDTHHNSMDGLHIASLAGSWLALVAGFGGLRDCAETLAFRPQLPPGWDGLRFGVRFRGQRLHVDISPGKVTYTVTGDAPVRIIHRSGDRSKELTLKPGKSTRERWTAVEPRTPRPTQPVGREPHGAL